MMSSAPDMESGQYFGTDSSGRGPACARCDWRAYLTHGRCCCGTGGAVGTLYGSLSGYLAVKWIR